MLVAGAVAAALGLVPAAAASTAVAEPAVDEPAGAAPRFVQEGTPVDVGGQAVPWGTALGLRGDGDTDYAWELPPGVTHTAISTGAGLTMMLRSDGQVVGMVNDDRYAEPVVPTLPGSLEYTAVAAGEGAASFFLRSDGSLVTVVRGQTPAPQIPALPVGTSYTAVDVGLAGAYAVRSDGQIVGIKVGSSSALPLTCTNAFVPPNGLAYTAINADHLSWAALRSDGAVVYCRYGSDAAEVVEPAEGTRYTGVDVARGLNDNSQGYGYATRDDGTIVGFGHAPEPATVPTNRTVVGLSAYVEYPNGEHVPGGAAVLDDGSVLTWGGAVSAPPPEIPGAPSFVAVSGSGSEQWLIRTGEAIPVELTVTSSTTVNHNETTEFNVSVMAGETFASGSARLGYLLEDGSTWWDDPKQVVDGRATFRFLAQPEGTYRRMVRFDGPPFATATIPVDFVVRPQQPSTLTVGMPDSWRTGAFDVHAQVDIEAEGGVSTEQGTIRVVAEESGEQLNVGFAAEGRYWLDTTVLPAGTHRVRVDYVSDGPAASASWTGNVHVLPQGETETTVESQPAGSFSDYGAYVDVDASVRTKDGSRLGYGFLEILGDDGETLASTGELFDGDAGTVSGRVSLPVDGWLPGTYPVTVAWVPSGESSYFKHRIPETLPSRWTGTMTIRRAFTSLDVDRPSGLVHGATGEVRAWVGSYAQTNVVGGEIVARIGGIEVGRADASGGRQAVPVDLSRILPGSHELEISYTGSDRLEPSSVIQEIEVGQGQFSAGTPGITGTARVGETLTANPGTWSPRPSTTTYVWKADGEVLVGQNASSLVVPASAVGKRITVAVTGERANYASLTSFSGPTLAVGGIFVLSKLPSVSGTTRVGSTLTAARGTWTPVPEVVRYQWRLDGRAYLGATSRTWRLPPSARGKKVTVAVTGIRTKYPARTAISPATTAVRAGIFVVPTLKITGTAKVGYTLKAVRGTWTPQPSHVKYQWKVGGLAVKGATGSSFTVPASARGKRVAVVVTGSRIGYTTRTVSTSTAVVR
jgi:hypothetical protein